MSCGSSGAVDGVSFFVGLFDGSSSSSGVSNGTAMNAANDLAAAVAGVDAAGEEFVEGDAVDYCRGHGGGRWEVVIGTTVVVVAHDGWLWQAV